MSTPRAMPGALQRPYAEGRWNLPNRLPSKLPCEAALSMRGYRFATASGFPAYHFSSWPSASQHRLPQPNPKKQGAEWISTGDWCGGWSKCQDKPHTFVTAASKSDLHRKCSHSWPDNSTDRQRSQNSMMIWSHTHRSVLQYQRVLQQSMGVWGKCLAIYHGAMGDC